MVASEPAQAKPPPLPEGGLLHGRCPICTGRVYTQDGQCWCMMCARQLIPTEMVPTTRGLRVLGFRVDQAAAKLTQVGHLEDRRNRRGLSANESRNGVAARVLQAIPYDGLVGISAIARKLSITNHQARETVAVLLEQGFIQEEGYGKVGYAWRGYRRATS